MVRESEKANRNARDPVVRGRAEQEEDLSSFYITTPIYYVNANPHLGHAYTTIVADAVNRFHRLSGEETFFLTGTDEHGDKIVRAAEENSENPREYVDRISELFRSTWPGLEVENDRFIRTTDPDHVRVVQDILQKVYDKGDIYFGEYGGYYCYGCERFYTEKELEKGLCPDHRVEPEYIKEANYFFRMRKYLDPLRRHIEKKSDFIRPERYANEVLGLLREGLDDLCISRPKSRLTWGIELPFDSGYVTYVWFDALINYITALGGPGGKEFGRFWPNAHHVVAKDILKPHAVFWPTMLMSAGIPLFKGLRVHGYWNVNETKMSKSLGNVVSPLSMKDKYGLAAFRYFLLREMNFGLDASFSEEALVGRLNSDLANDLGNLFNRVLAMTGKYFSGFVPPLGELAPDDKECIRTGFEALKNYQSLFADFRFSRALESLWEFVRYLNKYVDHCAPWVLNKNGQTDRLETVMYVLLEGMRKIALHLWPVMPSAAEEMLRQVGSGDRPDRGADLGRETREWGGLKPGVEVAGKSNLFPRQELVLQEAESSSGEKKKKSGKKPALKELVDFQDFQRLDMRSGKIVEVHAVEGADKLFRVLVDIGEDEPRQMVAGMAEHFSAAELTGRQVVVVSNLKPKKLRGVESRGMILAVKTAGGMELLTPSGEVPPGSRVS
ncbi:MAG: methionine--tRNA ligase [Desulfonatronovibrionaceae bacterium]